MRNLILPFSTAANRDCFRGQWHFRWFFVLVATTWLGCQESVTIPEAENPQSRERAVLTVHVSTAKPAPPVYETAVYFGKVRPQRSSMLGFSRGGRIDQILKGPGDTVERGEKLATMEQRHLENQKTLLEETLDSSRQDIAILQADASSSINQRQVDLLKEDISTLENQLQQLNAQLDSGVIYAPYKGIIATQFLHTGDSAAQGRPVLKIYEDAPAHVELNIADSLARKIQIGTQVWIHKDAQRRLSSVATISPELNQSSRGRAITLQMLEEDNQPTWTFGEMVEVRFWVPTDKQGFWIPLSALQQESDGLWSVLVVETQDDHQQVGRRVVELLHLESDFALVQGSLLEGAWVIVEGIHRVVPGQHVQAKQVNRNYAPTIPPGVVP